MKRGSKIHTHIFGPSRHTQHAARKKQKHKIQFSHFFGVSSLPETKHQ